VPKKVWKRTNVLTCLFELVLVGVLVGDNEWQMVEKEKEAGREKDLRLALEVMHEGSLMFKYSFRGRKPAKRVFVLSEDNKTLSWGLKKKKLQSSVDFEKVDSVVFGARTTAFQRTSRIPESRAQCFSLITRGDRTYDIMALNTQQAMYWFIGIQWILREKMGKAGIRMLYKPHLLMFRLIWRLRDEAVKKCTSLGNVICDAIRNAMDEDEDEDEEG
jgi:hypothetical protein